MKRRALPVIAVLTALSCSVSPQARAPGSSSPPLVPTEDPGVARAFLIDRPEVRVLRVEIQPGAVRRVHQHDDVRYHLFLPVTSGIELTVGSAKPAPAVAGQAYFMQKGTPHTFRNTTAAVAVAFEVFVKPETPVVQNQGVPVAVALATAPR